jgi:short-subunit dehydrogenase
MASLVQRYGSWALVAGSAEGLGEGFTLGLASLGFNLIMADINAPLLHRLADRIEAGYSVHTIRLHLDLAQADSWKKCMEAIEDIDCRLMIYVAAWSRVQRFRDLTQDDLDNSLAVNVHTPVHLVHSFSHHLRSKNNPGGILLMSSLAGLIGPKYVAPYAATKAYAIRLAESLHDELKEDEIDIMACCAGTISTPAYWKSNPSFKKMKPPVMEPEEVARYALRMLGKKIVCIPGWKNRLQYFLLLNLLPRWLSRRLVNRAMAAMYGEIAP